MLEDSPDMVLHHRLTAQFLSADLYAGLCQFAEGESFQNLSDGFKLAVAPLHFIPIVETLVESKHAVTTRLHRRSTH